MARSLICTQYLQDRTDTTPYRRLFQSLDFSVVPVLQNAAVNAIIYNLSEAWQLTDVNYLVSIYNNTSTNSPWRRL